MASPKSIPSKVSTGVSQITAGAGNQLYITALLLSANLSIDGQTVNGLGPVSISSPIACSSFTPAADGQVAYYEQ